jgi:cytochrome b561
VNARAPARYGAVAILLHWVTAALVFTLFVLGWRMVSLPLSPSKFTLYAQHKSLGLVVLALSGFRLAWRLAHRVPQAVDESLWRRRAAAIVHGLIYAALFALPVSGWLFNSAVGFPLSFFGVINMPPLSAPRPEWRETARLAHVWLGYALLAALGLHVAAALHRQFVRRDGTIARMLPSFGQSVRRTI